MEKTEKYIYIDTDMGELVFHVDVYENLIGKYPEEEREDHLDFFLKGCKNFARHPQDALWELERDLE